MFLKTSQLSLTKGPWTQGLQNIFQFDKQVLLAFTGKVQIALARGAASANDIGGIFMEDNKKHSKLWLLNKIWVQNNKTFYKQSTIKKKLWKPFKTCWCIGMSCDWWTERYKAILVFFFDRQ